MSARPPRRKRLDQWAGHVIVVTITVTVVTLCAFLIIGAWRVIL